MGLSYADAKRLNIGHLHPAASGGRSDEAIIRDLAGERAPPPKKEFGDGMTKLERSFAATLDDNTRHGVLIWWREPIKLKLAGRCWYHPDFMVIVDQMIKPVMIEVKGPFAREDSIIKLKTAASLYSCFWWFLVRREGRHGWEVREVNRTGISRGSIVVPWLSGGGT